MAVILTAAELANALRVGDSTEETAEVTRLLAYGTEAVTRHAPDAPDVVHNEAAIRLCGYLFDQPTSSRGMMYAAAVYNSGAAAILAPYRPVRALADGEDTSSGTAGSGLRLIATEAVDVAALIWVRTTLPAPTTTIFGISVRGPDGDETAITLFRAAQLTGQAVAGGDATAELLQTFALETASDGSVLFASREAGTHTVNLYEFG